jgi:hypothetical protein
VYPAAPVSTALSGARGLKRRPLAPHPTPGSEGEEVDGCRSVPHHETSQRRCAPMVILIAPES